MKLSLAATLVLLFTGCGDTTVKEGSGSVKAASDMSLPYTGGPTELVFTSPDNWNITSSETWLEVSEISGGGSESEQAVTLDYDRNSTSSVRKATVTITTGSGIKKISVTQDGLPLPLGTDMTSLTFDHEGKASVSAFTITKAPSAWKVEIPKSAGWISCSPLSGTAGDNKAVSVAVEKYNENSPRSATLLVTAGNYGAEITVTQSGVPFSVSESSLSFNAQGGPTRAVVVNAGKDFTIDVDAGWLRIRNERRQPTNSVAVTAGTPCTLYVSAAANPDGANRTGKVTLRSSDDSAEIAVSQSGETILTGTQAFPARWAVSSSAAGSGYASTFSDAAYAKSTNGPAVFTFVRTAGNQNAQPATYSIGSSGQLMASPMFKDDYWHIEVPVTALSGDNAAYVSFPFRSNRSGPKYYIFEYYENGVWKNTGNLKTATEDQTVKYSYKSYDNGTTEERVEETVVYTTPYTGTSLKFRLRSVANIEAGTGSAMKPETNSGVSLIAGDGYGKGPCISLMKGAQPAKSADVLFLGNSYTFYNSLPNLLKELAWGEGVDIRPAVSVTGAHTMARHLNDVRSKDLAARGGYEFAILQDQSLAPAKIGHNTAESPGIIKSMGDMTALIRASSTAVVPVVYATWGRKNTYTLDGEALTFDKMTERLTEGCMTQAETHDLWVSPVGIAWQKVRKENPSIELYNSDGSHPSLAGSYLAAATLYLTMFNTEFGESPATCGLDAATAKIMRDAALWAVLGRDDEWNIER